MRYGKVNMDNYELYIIDSLDGILDDVEQLALEEFLHQNPNLDAEYQDLNAYKLEQPNQKNNFDFLKKDLNNPPKTLCNSDNYEEKMAAFIEGDLSEEQAEDLRVFMEHQPKYQRELHLFNLSVLKPEPSVTLANKEILYQLATHTSEAISESNFETYCVAWVENDLSEKQKLDFQNYIANDAQKQSILSSYEKLRLKADTSLVMPGKMSLKRRTLFTYATLSNNIRIAASIVILLFLNLFIHDGSLVKDMEGYEHYVQTERNTPSLKTTSSPIKESENPTQRKIAYSKPKRMQPISKATPKKIDAIQKPIKMEMRAIPIENTMATADFEPSGYYETRFEKTTFLQKNPTLTRRLVKGVRNLFNISPEKIKVPANRLTLWDIADVGLKGFGKMTENDIVLSRN